MKINYVELYGGRCGLSANTEAQIRKQEGDSNIKRISVATKEQIEWVRAMGGYVPEKACES